MHKNIADMVSAIESRDRGPARPPPKRRNPFLLPLAIGLPVLALLGWGGWRWMAAQSEQALVQCQAALGKTQSAIDGNDLAGASAAAGEAERVCKDESLVKLQAMRVMIQEAQAQAQACDPAEAQARDLLRQAKPGEAKAALDAVQAQCAARESTSMLVLRTQNAVTEAASLLEQAKAQVAAKQPALARQSAENALKFDALVTGAADVMTEIERLERSLPAQSIEKPPPPETPKPRPVAETPPVKRPVVPEAPKPLVVQVGPATAPVAAPVAPAPAPEPPSQPAANARLVPVSTPAPDYPPAARRARTTGSVTVSFTVRADGSVDDVRILDARPRGLFERNVQITLRRWRFQPIAQAQTVTRTFEFKP